jgi:dephospho-CoA kinase
MKLAITGKMCSGKSTLSNYLVKTKNFIRLGYGDYVKYYASEIFGMERKDRKLLQDLGQKLKEIDPNVWVKLLEKNLDNLEKNGVNNVVIDDVRFPQEIQSLRARGFTILKLTINSELQKRRIIDTYPDDYVNHLSRINDISETFNDNFTADLIYDINENNEEAIFKFIDNKIGNRI